MLRITHPRDSREGRKGQTIVIDFGPDTQGWTGRNGLSDLLDSAGTYIDAAKIWALSAATLPEAHVKGVVFLYKEAGITTFTGGLLFEYALLKNDLDGLIELLRHLDIDGLEISENYITLDHDTRLAMIERFAKEGFSVVFEFGRKRPDEPVELDALGKIVMQASEAGAHHVIVEQGEFDLLEKTDPGIVQNLKAQPWFSQVYIEADPARFPDQHVELINRFGADINLANVAAGHVLRLEALRRGLGRPIDYPALRELVREAGMPES